MRTEMRFDLEISPLDLDQTLGCGQTFRWHRSADGAWSGPLGRHSVTISMSGRRLEVEAFPGGRGVREFVASHLRADDDIRSIQRILAKDPVLKRGLAHVKGLRIVKTDEWECLVSFVLATYANIPRITKMIETLSSRFGSPIAPGVRAFPTHAQLSAVSKAELAECGLGYRAGYVRELCETVDEGVIEDMKKLPYNDLRERLKELPGVGDKVADCVSLFGFGRLESFPIDVWMERALARLYHQKGTYGKLRSFAVRRFGQYAGYAQEYLYFNERLKAGDGACVFSDE